MNVRAKLAWLESHIVHKDTAKEIQRQPPPSQQNVVRHTARGELFKTKIPLKKTNKEDRTGEIVYPVGKVTSVWDPESLPQVRIRLFS